MAWNEHQLMLTYSEGPHYLEIAVDRYIFADTQEMAARAAAHYANQATSLIKVYYDKYLGRIVIDVNPNNLGIKEPSISSCVWYDESKGAYKTLQLGEIALYPVCNPDCETQVDEAVFIENITREYEDYLTTHNRLTFECTAYGVKESHTYLRESHGS